MRGTSYAQLEAFVVVAELCSFVRASKRLGMAPSSLSQSIRALEDRLGVRLFNRTTRSVALTRAGEHLLERLKPAFRNIDQAMETVHSFSNETAGSLRIVTSQAGARLVLAPMLGAFSQRYPDITLDVRIDDAITDIVRQGFDAGIRIGHLLERDMIARPLGGELAMCLVAAPDYIARMGLPQTPADLRQHHCIQTAHAATGSVFHWNLRLGRQRISFMPVGNVTINDDRLALEAALQGAGITNVLAVDAQPHIERGALVSLLQEWVQPLPPFHLFYPDSRYKPGPLKALIEHLMGQVTEPGQAGAAAPA